MTRPRSIPFQKAAVTSRPPEQRPQDAAPKLRFSDLLKARRPSNGAEAKGVDPALDDEHADEDIPVAELPVEAKDESSSEPDRDPADDLDTEWLDALVPTPESMGPLLEESRVAAAARAKAVADAPPVSPVVGEIAKTVARFCNERQVDASEGWQPERAEIVRPSATWTYLVHDNPFGSELDRLIAAVGRRLTGGN